MTSSKKKSVSKRIKKEKTRSISTYVSIIIPIIIIGYLLIANLVLDTSKTYSISEFTPTERFTQTDTLNINQNLVYFNVPAKGADKVILDIALNSDKDVYLGARNSEEWSYSYNPLYVKNIDFSNYEKIDNGYRVTDNNYVIATDKNIKPLPNYPKDFSFEFKQYETHLRGGHTFYVYTEGNLYFRIEKQDLNWYNGSDNPNVTIKQYDTIISQGTIPDDGIEIKGNPSKTTEYLEFDIPVTRGVYEIVVDDFDGIITSIGMKTNKFVIRDRVFLADAENYFGYKPAEIYFNPKRPMNTEIYTYHDSAVQEIKINDKTSSIKQRNERYTTNIDEETIIIPEKNNLIFEFFGYASFDKESFFIPFKNIVLPLSRANEADIIITDYLQPEFTDGYYFTSTTFDLDNLTLINDELSLVFNIKANTTVKEVKATVIKEGLI